MFVLFAIPAYEHKLHLNCVASLTNTMIVLGRAGIQHTWTAQPGVMFIDHVRNILVDRFLHEFPRATDLFFIDDDVGWDAEAVPRMLSHDVDIVAGIYPLKSDQGGYPVSVIADAKTRQPAMKDGLIKADFVPTGFMRMRRNVLEVMAEGQPTYPFRQSDGSSRDISYIFRSVHHSGERWGEDVDFCHRWAAKGGDIWVDPDIQFSHVGRKEWHGNFGTALAEYGPLVPKEAA